MIYLLIFMIISVFGTIFALCLLAPGARADEALEKQMRKTETVTPLNKSAKTAPVAPRDQSELTKTAPPGNEPIMKKTSVVLALFAIQAALIMTKIASLNN